MGRRSCKRNGACSDLDIRDLRLITGQYNLRWRCKLRRKRNCVAPALKLYRSRMANLLKPRGQAAVRPISITTAFHDQKRARRYPAFQIFKGAGQSLDQLGSAALQSSRQIADEQILKKWANPRDQSHT